MMADPKIDVVYVATVHPRHLPDALAAIEAGKHVLVEKPLALNASEARRLKEAARRKGVFLMEAFWSAFLPKFDIIRQLLADGALGSLRTVIADHGEWFPPETESCAPNLQADRCSTSEPIRSLLRPESLVARTVLWPSEKMRQAV